MIIKIIMIAFIAIICYIAGCLFYTKDKPFLVFHPEKDRFLSRALLIFAIMLVIVAIIGAIVTFTLPAIYNIITLILTSVILIVLSIVLSVSINTNIK
ncbi:hypothetical protein R4Y45_03560 [Holzapfeliella sp. He02]|uniref:DUF3784 domain-containing protein n=1 Tax=Holzapfeliella saturejae TaxID=3082953 RepID=A0ABU8SHZ0_9LACO